MDVHPRIRQLRELAETGGREAHFDSHQPVRRGFMAATSLLTQGKTYQAERDIERAYVVSRFALLCHPPAPHSRATLWTPLRSSSPLCNPRPHNSSPTPFVPAPLHTPIHDFCLVKVFPCPSPPSVEVSLHGVLLGAA
mmetsp:Transcript_17907/g.41139  ORF Transcript_17907/g.41139 Transcript_17907/m.41139 type:complete len:138 (-) Transcript_17907:345-758(-)